MAAILRALLASALGACASAVRNPSASEIGAAAPPPARAAAPAIAPVDEPAPPVQPAAEAAQNPSPQAPPPPQAPDDAPGAPADGPQEIARVGGRPLPAAALLQRLWVRDNTLARQLLEHLVFGELALLEAERLGITLEPEAIDANVERARGALAKKLEVAGSKLTVDEHVQRNLDMEPGRYERELRRDAIVQLLIERCVRAWLLEEGSAVVRALELDSAEDVVAVQEGLQRGESFEALAGARAAQGGEPGGRRLVLARSEHNELARLAFATAVGEVGGPLAIDGRFVLVQVEERSEARAGGWRELATAVEAGLAAAPLSDFEFAQWRDAMLRRYVVDLAPFLALVGAAPRALDR